MNPATQDLYQQNLNDLLEQVINHHSALLRCKQFSGHLTFSGDWVELVVDEGDAVVITRKFDLSDKFVMERLRGVITTMQELLPATSAVPTRSACLRRSLRCGRPSNSFTTRCVCPLPSPGR